MGGHIGGSVLEIAEEKVKNLGISDMKIKNLGVSHFSTNVIIFGKSRILNVAFHGKTHNDQISILSHMIDQRTIGDRSVSDHDRYMPSINS